MQVTYDSFAKPFSFWDFIHGPLKITMREVIIEMAGQYCPSYLWLNN